MIQASRSVVLIISFFVLSTYGQNTPLSPCPDVFMYESPGSEPGRWYGVITVTTDITLHGLWLNIVLDSKADNLGNWIGNISTLDNKDFKIENTDKKIQPGPPQTIRFFVQYDQLNKIPRLEMIRLNGREICNANNPQPSVDLNVNVRPGDYTRPTERPTRTEQVTNRPSRPQNNRPQETTRPANVRPEEQTVSRPVQGRPNGDGPVYVPTKNPPIDESNVNPYSIGGGSATAQSIGTQTGSNQNGFRKPPQRPRPSNTQYEEPDFVDSDGRPSSDADYFGGGLPTISISGGSGSSNNRRQDQCGVVIRNANPNPLVVNGKPTLEGQWPWQIALYQTQLVDNKYICGGTLVSRRYVVTAAHCITRTRSRSVVNKNTLTVYLGKHNLRTSIEGVQIQFVSEILVHPQYNATSFSQDLGVLRLRDAVQYTDWVRPACLWPEDQVDLKYVIGKIGSVVGWGFDDKGLATEELALAEMPVVKQETCIRSYSEFFARFTSSETYCAGFRNGTSVCNGDSGGGMVFNIEGYWYLRGIVSLSIARQNENRCDTSHYVVFTDVAKFLPWLRQHIIDD